MDKLPYKYTPSVLRRIPTKEKNEPIRYGVGIKYRDGTEVGMTDGPFESIFDALEIVGEENSGVFELPSGVELYYWSPAEDRWIKNDPIDPKR